MMQILNYTIIFWRSYFEFVNCTYLFLLIQIIISQVVQIFINNKKLSIDKTKTIQSSRKIKNVLRLLVQKYFQRLLI